MRLLVTGGSGFLGSNVVRVAREQHDADVLALVKSWRPETAVPFEWASVDLADRDSLRQAAEAFRPDAIVHTAILNDLGRMYTDRQLAWESYVEATRAVVDVANELHAQFVLVSTDWVFDGQQPGADETTPPNPVNYYGALKLVCETVVQERAADGAIARVAGVNGVHWLRSSPSIHQNAGFGYLANAAVRNLSTGQPFAVWEAPMINMAATPSLASDCAEMILGIVDGGLQGTFHCCGGESVTRMGFVQAVAEVFDLDRSLIHTCSPPHHLPNIQFPADASLDATWTAGQLGRDLLDVHEMLERMRHQLETATL